METEKSVEAPEQSIQEKIADKIFGPEADDHMGEEPQDEPEGLLAEDEGEPEVEEPEDTEEPVEAADPDLEMVEIEIDGEVLEVPKKYSEYFLRQQDYTKKTQEVATERKMLEVIRGETEARARQYEFAESVWDDVMKAQAAQSAAEQYQQYLRQNVDNLSSTEIEKLRIAISDSQQEAQRIASEVQAKQQEHQQAQEQSLQELLNKGTEVLKQRIKNWGPEAQEQVHKQALVEGYSEAEIRHVLDPRHVTVLWKAAQYDALKKGAAPAVKRVQNAPTIKPKSRNPMPDDVKRKLNTRKKLKSSNLSAADKADIIREDIADRLGL